MAFYWNSTTRTLKRITNWSTRVCALGWTWCRYKQNAVKFESKYNTLFQWNAFGDFFLQMWSICKCGLLCPGLVRLTHLPLDKTAAISQTIFSDAFSWAYWCVDESGQHYWECRFKCYLVPIYYLNPVWFRISKTPRVSIYSHFVLI